MPEVYPKWFRDGPFLARRLYELGIPASRLLDALYYLAILPVERCRMILRMGLQELLDVTDHAEYLRSTESQAQQDKE